MKGISNIKIRFKVNFKFEKCVCSSSNLNHSKNFCVLREKFVFIIFRFNISNTINVTKIENIKHILEARNILKKKFNLKNSDFEFFSNRKKFIVDNITYSNVLNEQNFSLRLFYEFLGNNKFLNSKYRLFSFPAIQLWKRNHKGKILLFRSGKYNIVGVKCCQQIHYLKKRLIAIMRIWSQMKEKEQLCVLTAD